MILLLIWDGSYLDKWRRHCIETALTMYHDADKICITPLAEFYGMRCIPPIYWTKKYKKSMDDIKGLSDYIRFDFLSKNERTLYIDTDVLCLERMPETRECGQVTIQAIWSGQECWKIWEVFRRHENKQILWHLRKEMPGLDLKKYFIHKPKERFEILERAGY